MKIFITLTDEIDTVYKNYKSMKYSFRVESGGELVTLSDKVKEQLAQNINSVLHNNDIL